MLAIFTVTAPFFALILCGYLAARFRLPPDNAVPVAGTVFLFAERQGADAERISAAILVSTALAFFSFSALCAAFGSRLAARLALAPGLAERLPHTQQRARPPAHRARPARD